MVPRLGIILDLASKAIGLSLLAFMVYGWATAMPFAHQVAIGVLAVIALLIGRSARFVLSGQ